MTAVSPYAIGPMAFHPLLRRNDLVCESSPMPGAVPFRSIHSHGLVRLGAGTPLASAGDVAANAAGIVALARQADGEGVDLLVLPELALSSYAIDDLHLQDAL